MTAKNKEGVDVYGNKAEESKASIKEEIRRKEIKQKIKKGFSKNKAPGETLEVEVSPPGAVFLEERPNEGEVTEGVIETSREEFPDGIALPEDTTRDVPKEEITTSTLDPQIVKIYKELSTRMDKFARVICDNLTGEEEIPEFHKDIYTLLRDKERVVLAAPRGFAKSSIGARIYPLWCALFKKKKEICIISASEGLAVEHLRYIKMQIETNQLIKTLWGDLKSDKWTESHLGIKHADGTVVTLRARGAGGQIRGFRPDCVILDDVETDDSVESEDQRKKLKDWLLKACINTLLPGGQMILIGTVIHYLSVLNDLLETPNKWEKRRFKAYKDGIEAPGHELWADKRPHEWLQARKAEIGSNRFYAEFMNDPKSDDTAPIQEKHIRYWETLPAQMNMAIALDPAYSDDETSDFKVAVAIGIDSNNNRYLVDYVRTHAPAGEYIDQAFNLYQRFSGMVTAFGVPDAGVEKAFFRTVTQKAFERKLGIPIIPLGNTVVTAEGVAYRKKKNRIIAALQPWFEKGQYYIHASHIEARDELLTIGNSRWDDIVDAMASAEMILVPAAYEAQEYSREKILTKAGQSAGYGIEY